MKNYGILLGKLDAYGLNFKEIHSTQWYRRYKIPSGLKTKDRKQMTAAIMSELYPEVKPMLYGPRGGLLDGRSDALAIAHHMKMLHSELSS